MTSTELSLIQICYNATESTDWVVQNQYATVILTLSKAHACFLLGIVQVIDSWIILEGICGLHNSIGGQVAQLLVHVQRMFYDLSRRVGKVWFCLCFISLRF